METDLGVRVFYLMTAPPPAIEGTDAVLQEAETLRSRFGGELAHLTPSPRPWARIPRPLHGLHMLRSLRHLERQVDLHHIYHAELFSFPVLRLLRKPIVYTVVAGLRSEWTPSAGLLARLSAIAVPSQRDMDRLVHLGVSHAHLVRPGIDVSRYSHNPIQEGDGITLLAGSAPWTKEQFRTKGVDALLRVARKTPSLRLVFLWRGWLLEDLRKRVASLDLSDRVEVISERADVDRILGRVHAAVVLAEEQRLVKAYPNSLMEALVCGRPILVSSCIAMADYVGATGCGRVVTGIQEGALLEGIRHLERDYASLQANARQVGRRDFSQERLVEAYQVLYESVVESEGAPVGPHRTPPS